MTACSEACAPLLDVLPQLGGQRDIAGVLTEVDPARLCDRIDPFLTERGLLNLEGRRRVESVQNPHETWLCVGRQLLNHSPELDRVEGPVTNDRCKPGLPLRSGDLHAADRRLA